MTLTTNKVSVDLWFEPILGPLSGGVFPQPHPIWRFNGYVCVFGVCLQLTVRRIAEGTP